MSRSSSNTEPHAAERLGPRSDRVADVPRQPRKPLSAEPLPDGVARDLNSTIDGLRAGEPVDLEALIRRHPGYRERLIDELELIAWRLEP